jgi:signal transduction histidine kinase
VNRQSAIDAPVELSELLTSADIEEVIASCARLFSYGIVVFNQHGGFLARVDATVDLAWAKSTWSEEIACGPDGGRYLKQPLIHDGLMIGSIIVGPFAFAESGQGGEQRAGQSAEQKARVLAKHAARMLSVMTHSAYARYLTGVVHVASMDQALAELEEKNERLLRAVERMQELDNLKTRFLATISHELRTPLTSVIGYSEMMLGGLSGDLNNDQREYVQTIFDKADHLLQLITKVLDVSQIEAGELQVVCSPIPIAHLVESVVSDVSGQAVQRSVTIVTPDADGIPSVSGDPEKVRRILWHLLMNAIKFSNVGGSVEVVVDVAPLVPRKTARAPSIGPGGELFGVRVVVCDEGIGIAREAQSNVFEPFFQVDSSSTRQYGGTGLGLTLAKRYVEAHGGHIWVESAPGAGSSFHVTLPAVKEELRAYTERGEP